MVNLKTNPYDIYIGRGSKWGNPYSHKYGTAAKFIVETREEAIRLYEEWFFSQSGLLELARKELKGKILGCYCKPLACHGDFLVRIVNDWQLCLPLV